MLTISHIIHTNTNNIDNNNNDTTTTTTTNNNNDNDKHRTANTVSFHNFKSQKFKLSVSNPKNKHVAYLSLLS